MKTLTTAGELTATDLGTWIIDPHSDTIARLAAIQHTNIAADKTTTIRLELGGYAIARNLSPSTLIEKCPPHAQNRAPDATGPQTLSKYPPGTPQAAERPAS